MTKLFSSKQLFSHLIESVLAFSKFLWVYDHGENFPYLIALEKKGTMRSGFNRACLSGLRIKLIYVSSRILQCHTWLNNGTQTHGASYCCKLNELPYV